MRSHTCCSTRAYAHLRTRRPVRRTSPESRPEPVAVIYLSLNGGWGGGETTLLIRPTGLLLLLKTYSEQSITFITQCRPVSLKFDSQTRLGLVRENKTSKTIVLYSMFFGTTLNKTSAISMPKPHPRGVTALDFSRCKNARLSPLPRGFNRFDG